MNQRGVSPVIATVLLIGIVIALGVIVFVWFSSFTQEAITKFNGENVQVVCNDVKFDASYASDGTLALSNNGNVPIFDFNVQFNSAGGSFTTQDIKNLINWPNIGLRQGGVFSGNILSEVQQQSANQIILIPILRGTVSNGDQKSFTCPSQYGEKVSIM
jgi:flagellin-like protein